MTKEQLKQQYELEETRLKLLVGQYGESRDLVENIDKEKDFEAKKAKQLARKPLIDPKENEKLENDRKLSLLLKEQQQANEELQL